MILGIGADMCEIQRIRDAIESKGDRLLSRLYTDKERAQSEAWTDPSKAFALRFAAKEACGKALGTGLTARVRWTDCEILETHRSQIGLKLAGGALRRARWLAGWSSAIDAQLSIDLTTEYAKAFVIIQREG